MNKNIFNNVNKNAKLAYNVFDYARNHLITSKVDPSLVYDLNSLLSFLKAYGCDKGLGSCMCSDEDTAQRMNLTLEAFNKYFYGDFDLIRNQFFLNRNSMFREFISKCIDILILVDNKSSELDAELRRLIAPVAEGVFRSFLVIHVDISDHDPSISFEEALEREMDNAYRDITTEYSTDILYAIAEYPDECQSDFCFIMSDIRNKHRKDFNAQTKAYKESSFRDVGQYFIFERYTNNLKDAIQYVLDMKDSRIKNSKLSFYLQYFLYCFYEFRYTNYFYRKMYDDVLTIRYINDFLCYFDIYLNGGYAFSKKDIFADIWELACSLLYICKEIFKILSPYKRKHNHLDEIISECEFKYILTEYMYDSKGKKIDFWCKKA